MVKYSAFERIFRFNRGDCCGFVGFGRALAVGLGASAAIALAGLAWQSPSSRNCELITICGLHRANSPVWRHVILKYQLNIVAFAHMLHL